MDAISGKVKIIIVHRSIFREFLPFHRNGFCGTERDTTETELAMVRKAREVIHGDIPHRTE